MDIQLFLEKSRLIENLDRLTPGVFMLKSGNKRADSNV